jgi:hypothetical protein
VRPAVSNVRNQAGLRQSIPAVMHGRYDAVFTAKLQFRDIEP